LQFCTLAESLRNEIFTIKAKAVSGVVILLSNYEMMPPHFLILTPELTILILAPKLTIRATPNNQRAYHLISS
jgi:hypothetical protein